MQERPDPTARTSSEGVEGWAELQMCGSPEELALVAELAELDRLEVCLPALMAALRAQGALPKA